MRQRLLCLVGGCALFVTGIAAAGEFTASREQRPITLGAGVMWRDQIYDDFSNNDKFSPVPLIYYEGEKFFFRLDKAGWKLLSNDSWEIAPIIEIRNDGYDSNSSDTLAGMRDTDPWIGAGGQVIFQPGAFGGSLTATGDIADESNGGLVVGEAFYDTRTGNFTLNGNTGLEWWSEGRSDYYYGVQSGDAIPLVRPAYSAGTTTQFYVGGSAIYQRPNSNWLVLGFFRHMWFDDDIEDSPITSDDKQFIIGAGVAYTFGRN